MFTAFLCNNLYTAFLLKVFKATIIDAAMTCTGNSLKDFDIPAI